jgi:transcriptional regulator with XRE-family HTH domain
MESGKIVEMRRALGRSLAERREAAGFSQHALAPRIHYGRSTIANVETGRQNAPRDFWVSCDAVLDAGGVLVQAYDALNQVVSREHSEPEALDVELESTFDIVQRVQAASRTSVDDVTLDQLETLILTVIHDYERAGPRVLAPGVLRQRHWVQQVMQQPNPPRHTARLYLSAARLSGVLAVIALDSRRIDTARAYAVEAFHLAQLVTDPEAQSWVRATQSLIEYYAGQYQQSLAFAVDGFDLAPRGTQAIRLLVNGQARALARMGDREAVVTTVGLATELLGQLGQPGKALSDSLDVRPYCAARLAGNAATAFLQTGDMSQVLAYLPMALRAYDSAGVRGPQALSRLDMATALVQGQGADLEQAASLVHEALSVTGAADFAPVATRAVEFLATVHAQRHEPVLQPVIEHIRELTSEAGRD